MRSLPTLSLLGILAVPIWAQNVTLDSYAKARPILDRAIAAYGGLSELRGIENVTFRVEGDSQHRNQSAKPFTFDRTPYKAEYIMDVRNNRYRQQQSGHFPGGFDWVNGFSLVGGQGTGWDVLRGIINPSSPVPVSAFRARLRMMPQFVILDAANRSSRVRYLGTTTFDGRAHVVISYANEDGAELSLYIDEKTGLLSKVEELSSDSFFGDIVNESIFSEYREENGRMVPGKRLSRSGGDPTGELRLLDVKFNVALTDASFAPPEGLKAPKPSPPSQPSVKYSDNVYTVNAGGYNVLAVGFKDHVFVMETPNGDSTSRQAIAEIKKIFPGKPIRYFAVTHHHSDHAGGIRTYIAEEATLLALPIERPFFEKVVASKFTIGPDTLSRSPKPLKIETIEKGKRVLTDGTTTVELIDIGPGGHTDEMLVAYLPAEKLVFQGDLLNRPANGDPATINATTVHFANWLDKSGLAVDRIIGVHGPPSTRAELRQGVAANKK